MPSQVPQRPIYQKGQKPANSPVMRAAAKGKTCKLAIPGICDNDPAKVVGCHMRLFGFGGMGVKPDDLFIIDACASCHAVLDSRGKWASAGLGWDAVLRAFMQTLSSRRAEGLISIGKKISGEVVER